MSLDLSKGQKIDLSKTPLVDEAGVLKDIYIGAGWDMADYGDEDFDLDIIALAISNNQVKETLFFNNKKSDCGGIQLSDDNRTGEGDGDDEFVNVTVADLNPEFDKLVFGINIFEGVEKGQVFGQIKESYMRIVNAENDEEIAKFDLEFDGSTDTGLVFCELIKRNDKWYFSAVGKGFQGSVQDFVNLYS